MCDFGSHDDLRFKAEYATDNPFGPSVYTVQAPQGACESDRTFVSWIKVFKLCVGHPMFGSVVWEDCNRSIWTT